MTKPISARAELSKALQTRAYPVQLEVRSNSNGTATVEGYASVTESPYDMYDWAGKYVEIIHRGAFAKTLSEHPQVQLLLNHGGLSMAYTNAGTLRLAEDDTGLHIGADLNTKRNDVSDMVAALGDGNIDEMSFAFRVTAHTWSPDYDQRDIHEVDIHRGDVSVVNFGANPATSAALRAQFLDALGDDDARQLYERLGARLNPPPQIIAADTRGMSVGLVAAYAQRARDAFPVTSTGI